jgi:hypothetical protein
MGKVILLPQPLHPLRGCLRIEHKNKNVSIDTLKLKLKLNELLLKNLPVVPCACPLIQVDRNPPAHSIKAI